MPQPHLRLGCGSPYKPAVGLVTRKSGVTGTVASDPGPGRGFKLGAGPGPGALAAAISRAESVFEPEFTEVD